MSNEKIEHGIFEVKVLDKWAFLEEKKIEYAKKVIAPYTLFKTNLDVKAYIAKIVIFSLFFNQDIKEIIKTDPKSWTIEPDCLQTESNFYSIQKINDKKKIIIATNFKAPDNIPYCLIFSENNRKDKQPWFFNGIRPIKLENNQVCITDIIKDVGINLESKDIPTSEIAFMHILDVNDEKKGIYRFPTEFQELNDQVSELYMIINNSIDTQKQNIKSTIRYDENKNQIVSCHYLPLDFSGCGGTKHELYACLRKIEGPGNRFEIPTILPYHMVYSQLLEKPKIDHWTYALCKFEENEIKKRNRELEEKLKMLEKV